MKIAFMVMSEFLKHQQVYTMLKMLDAAKAKGHEIKGIFFFGSGVISLKKKTVLGKNTRNIPEALGKIAQEGIPIYACQTWADNYGIFPENVVDGVQILGLGELSTMTYESDKLIAFGARV